MGVLDAFDRLPHETRANSSPATLFQLFLLHEYKVATMDRRSFSTLGSEGQHFLRISTANADAELVESVRQIEAATKDATGFERFVTPGRPLTL
jgi:aspartate/methionine/tyrosine aminotransferase